jgi:hypothetical protein
MEDFVTPVAVAVGLEIAGARTPVLGSIGLGTQTQAGVNTAPGPDLGRALNSIKGLAGEAKVAGKELRKALRRPYIRKGVREKVKEAQPRDANGNPVDPNTGKAISFESADLGHKPGHEHRTEKAAAEAANKTQKEFNEEAQNPDKYHYEDPSSNRSHRYEKKDE